MQRHIVIGLIIGLLIITYVTPLYIKKLKVAGGEPDEARQEIERQDLLARIERMQIAYDEVRKSEKDTVVRGKIFSKYPFNNKHRITLSVGSEEGVVPAAIVTVGENILVGYIKEVTDRTSSAETIFDPSFQLPVRIGISEVDGMIQGGIEPKITMVEKTKRIQKGDVVVVTAEELPYGLKIGEINEVKDNPGSVFYEASMRLPYNINELREVNVRIRP